MFQAALRISIKRYLYCVMVGNIIALRISGKHSRSHSQGESWAFTFSLTLIDSHIHFYIHWTHTKLRALYIYSALDKYVIPFCFFPIVFFSVSNIHEIYMIKILPLCPCACFLLRCSIRVSAGDSMVCLC